MLGFLGVARQPCGGGLRGLVQHAGNLDTFQIVVGPFLAIYCGNPILKIHHIVVKVFLRRRAGAKQKQTIERAKYNVRHLQLIEDGLYKVEVRNHREGIVAKFFEDLCSNLPGCFASPAAAKCV